MPNLLRAALRRISTRLKLELHNTGLVRETRRVVVVHHDGAVYCNPMLLSRVLAMYPYEIVRTDAYLPCYGHELRWIWQ